MSADKYELRKSSISASVVQLILLSKRRKKISQIVTKQCFLITQDGLKIR